MVEEATCSDCTAIMMKTPTPHGESRFPLKRLNTPDSALHPAWRALIEYCGALKHGEIETLKIQDGLPVLAEVVRKKVKFTP